MAKQKTIGIRGINPLLWDRFVNRVKSIEYTKGKRRGKHSYVAAELNRVLEAYLDGDIKIDTATAHTMVKQKLRETQKEKGFVSKKDINVAFAYANIRDDRTMKNILRYLNNTGFFAEMGLEIHTPSIIDNMKIRVKTKELTDDEIQNTLRAFKRDSKIEVV